MDVNETVKSIHRLATLRDNLSGRDYLSIVIHPEGSQIPISSGEVADVATKWMAQTYRGKGQWGNLAGEGDSPEEALASLLRGLVDAHEAVDVRRTMALKASVTVP